MRVATGGSLDADPPADPPPACPKCKDRGFLRRDVEAGHPDFGQIIVCPCRRKEVAEKRQSRLERLSNLGPLTRLTFDNLEPEGRSTDPRRRERYSRIVARGRAFADAPDGWLLIAGPPGCGKTHLAAAIANTRLAEGEAVIFSVVPDLLDHLRAAFSPNSEIGYDELFESVREAPLLILDDLGTQSGTPWAQEKLFQLLNYRYNAELPTVITSNLALKDQDPRIESRMLDPRLCDVWPLDVPPYRLDSGDSGWRPMPTRPVRGRPPRGR